MRLATRATSGGDAHGGNIGQSTRQTWGRVTVQTARDLWTSSVFEWASSLAFYAMLSLFPLLVASMVVASYIVDAAWATEQAITLLGQFIPEGETEIEKIVTEAIAERRRVGLISFILALLTGRRILGGLVKGLNHVSDVAERDDSMARKAGIEAALAGGLIILIGLALVSRRLIALLWRTMEVVPGADGPAFQIVSASVRAAMLFAVFTLVYAFVPRGTRLWRAVLTGAALATALFLIAQLAFAVLGGAIWENLSLIYGPLALAALLLVWSWYVALITLVGAGFASHVKVMILEQRSGEEAGDQHTAI